MAKKPNYKDMTRAELIVKRDELKRSILDLRFQSVLGHVENPNQKKMMRHQLAALNTFIRQKELAGEK